MSTLKALSVACLIAAVCAPTFASAQDAPQGKIDPRIHEEVNARGAARVIVALRPAPPGGAPSAAAAHPANYLSGVLSADAQNVQRIAYLPMAVAELSLKAIDQLAQDPNVAVVIKDEALPSLLDHSAALVGAPPAWSMGLGGRGQVIAILDTGIDLAHPGFAGKVVGEACFSTAASTIIAVETLCPNGLEVATMSGSANACSLAGCDHGTHVAGIAAAKRVVVDGREIQGIAHEAGIFPIQVFTRVNDVSVCGAPPPCVRSFISDQIRALTYVKDRADDGTPITAVNMSLGGGHFRKKCDSQNPVYTEIIEELYQRNIAVVVAAGNDSHFDGIAQPACVSRAVSVTGTNKSDQLDFAPRPPGYANVAPDVDLAAPGTSIFSTTINSAGQKSGTSMAAPHVTGAWAVLRSAMPSATVDQIQAALKSTGLPVQDPRTTVVVRRISVEKALGQVQAGAVAGAPASTNDSVALGVPDGAKRVVVVPHPSDPAASMTTDQLGSHLKSATPGLSGAPVITSDRAVGTQRQIIIESPTGIFPDVLRGILTPRSRIFEDRADPPLR